MELADGKSNPDRQMVSNYFKKYSWFTFRKLRLRFRFRFEVQISDSSDSSDSDSDSGVLKIGTFFLIQSPLEIFQSKTTTRSISLDNIQAVYCSHDRQCTLCKGAVIVDGLR